MAGACTWMLRHRYATDNEEYWFIVCDTRFTPRRADRDWGHCPYCGRYLKYQADDAAGVRHLQFVGLAG